jgi:glycosyltransferase involved in cell wall biosynthesis
MLKIVQAIGLLAERIIVTTKNSLRLLEEDYNLPREKIIIIPHGTHNPSPVSPEQLKAKYGLEQRQVLTTFGLLSPNKGIEKGILAMKGISARFPDAMYVVLGQTHPNLLEQEGEKYRTYLQDLILENDLQKNVLLINEFVPDKKLMEYLALTDIYLFTSKDPNQAVSGTFIYAMSAGCPIISTDFVLGREMLDANTGVILATNDEKELADHVIHILDNPALKKEMSRNAFLKTKHFSWKNVGQQHVNLFNTILTTAPDAGLLTGALIS